MAQGNRRALREPDPLAALVRPRLTPYVPHVPTPKQQAALCRGDLRELLYGGAAGGGKSDFILAAALQYVDVPGYSALILRRTFPMLAQSDGLLPRAQEWLAPTDAKGSATVNGLPTVWSFPSGARLIFGHMQHLKDRFQYQGGAYQFVGFDELTQFLEPQYRYLFSRLRRLEGSAVPLRVRATSNPGGEGHEWVKGRFVTGPKAFMPAKLSDNPHLDQAEYEASLAELHPYERQQLLDGDWDARPPGARFKREWVQVVDAPSGRIVKEGRAWDLAATAPKPGRDPDWTASVRWYVTEAGVFGVVPGPHWRKDPGDLEAAMRQTVAAEGGGLPHRVEQEPGSSGKLAAAALRRAVFPGATVRFVPSTGDKLVRFNPVCSTAHDGWKGIGPGMEVVRNGYAEDYLTELEMAGEPGWHDDWIDATSAAHEEAFDKAGFGWGDLYPAAKGSTGNATESAAT